MRLCLVYGRSHEALNNNIELLINAITRKLKGSPSYYFKIHESVACSDSSLNYDLCIVRADIRCLGAMNRINFGRNKTNCFQNCSFSWFDLVNTFPVIGQNFEKTKIDYFLHSINYFMKWKIIIRYLFSPDVTRNLFRIIEQEPDPQDGCSWFIRWYPVFYLWYKFTEDPEIPVQMLKSWEQLRWIDVRRR